LSCICSSHAFFNFCLHKVLVKCWILLVLEVFELLGLFLTVLELNDGLDVLGVLCLFDLLLEFLVQF
jgi:hypothetical protein